MNKGDRVRIPSGDVGTIVAVVEPGGSWMGAMKGRLHGYDSGPLRRRLGDGSTSTTVYIVATGITLHGLEANECKPTTLTDRYSVPTIDERVEMVV